MYAEEYVIFFRVFRFFTVLTVRTVLTDQKNYGLVEENRVERGE